METAQSRFHVAGLDCPSCAARVERAIQRLDGVLRARLNFATRALLVDYRPGAVTPEEIRRTIEALGYRVEEPQGAASRRAHSTRWVPVVTSGTLLAAGMACWAGDALGMWSLPGLLELGPGREVTAATVLLALAIVAGGYGITRRAITALRHRTFDINLLMVLAAVGAGVIWEWAEGASAMFLFSLALVLESHAMGRAERAVTSLMSLAPASARVRREAELRDVPAEEVRPGETVVVRAGETIPVDGVVAGGATEVNEAPVTGESLPAAKQVGDAVLAGSINQHGVLEVRSTRAPGNSTLARILHLVQEAESSRAPSQQFVQRFARWYTPAVIVGAVLVAVVPPLALDQPWASWFFRALVLLVIACPCALVISTPVSIVSALASAARRGILIKGGSHLENLGRVRTFIFDKTGTLTRGRFSVNEVRTLGGASDDEVVRVAASVSSHSEHLLAEAIRRHAAESGIAAEDARDTIMLPGRGTQATVGGRTCRVGNLRLAEDLGLADDAVRHLAGALSRGGRSVVLVCHDQTVLGAMALADGPRDEARAALQTLRRLGARDLVMLTGDNEATARAVSEAVGLDHVHAGLLPEDKVEKVRFLTRRDGVTAMAGDGVNDAPALAAATVGIAMGAAGTDAAMETADVVLMTDRLDRVPEAVGLGRRTARIIRQNMALALGLKVVFFALALANVATLWMAVAADMGASLLVIANGLRLLGNVRTGTEAAGNT